MPFAGKAINRDINKNKLRHIHHMQLPYAMCTCNVDTATRSMCNTKRTTRAQPQIKPIEWLVSSYYILSIVLLYFDISRSLIAYDYAPCTVTHPILGAARALFMLSKHHRSASWNASYSCVAKTDESPPRVQHKSTKTLIHRRCARIIYVHSDWTVLWLRRMTPNERDCVCVPHVSVIFVRIPTFPRQV